MAVNEFFKIDNNIISIRAEAYGGAEQTWLVKKN
jgi:hypothetical protein